MAVDDSFFVVGAGNWAIFAPFCAARTVSADCVAFAHCVRWAVDWNGRLRNDTESERLFGLLGKRPFAQVHKNNKKAPIWVLSAGAEGGIRTHTSVMLTTP